MKTQTKEPSFNSKELNKILPSYLLDEIDEEQKHQNNLFENSLYDSSLVKENKNVRKIS
jgi:hypothetical protein